MSDKDNIVARVKQHIEKAAEDRSFVAPFRFESCITMPIYAKRLPITEEGIHKVLKWAQQSPTAMAFDIETDPFGTEQSPVDEVGNRADIIMDAVSTLASMNLTSLWDSEMYALICAINDELETGPLGLLVWVHSFTWDGNFDITFKYVDAGTFRAKNRLKNYRSYFESVKYKHAMAWLKKVKGE